MTACDRHIVTPEKLNDPQWSARHEAGLPETKPSDVDRVETIDILRRVDSGKKIDGAKKQLTSLNKEADKFFKAWELDLASISSESLREKSTHRMEAAKKKYASIGETLGMAGQEFAPVVQELNDQILYLGRDLSPEAIADLQDEAAALNQQADEVTTRVQELLQAAGNTQVEADAAVDAEERE